MALRILSYNILEGGEGRLAFIANVIQQQRPDVVALLEARSRTNAEVLARQLGMHMILGEANNSHKDNVVWLSRFPIIRAENHHIPVFAKTLLEIEIHQEETPVTLFATHLKSGQDQERERFRIAEMQKILEILQACKNQFHLLVGDLNTVHPDDQPDLAVYIEDLKRKGRENPDPQFPRAVIPLLLGAGYIDCYRTLHPSTPGYTAHTGAPALRIDYAFASPPLAERLVECDVVTDGEAEMASDHFPIRTDFR